MSDSAVCTIQIYLLIIIITIIFLVFMTSSYTEVEKLFIVA